MPSSVEQLSAILVEDNPADARLIRELARDCRHIELQITHFDRLAPALEVAVRAPFDVMLLDLGLPDVAGFDTLIRTHAAVPRLPIIVMTGADSESFALDALRAGAQDYLVKGTFDGALLERSIRYAVGRAHTMLALQESEERYSLAVAGASDGVWDWALGPDEVRQGMERGEFCWFYQPIVCLHTGQVLGFEALLRWQHSERGLVPPDGIISLLEETRLMTPLFQQLLPKALERLSLWQTRYPRTPPLFINVNLSRSQLTDGALLSFIDDVRARHPCLPYSLCLEFTEDVVMGDSSMALSLLRELKDRGLRLVLDDFGMGYSSLSRLQRLPIDELKIDRSFVAGLPWAPESVAITRAIVNLAHALGMSVTAEGIEDPAQLREAQELRCDHGQGFLFSRPIPGDEIAALDFSRLCSTKETGTKNSDGRILLVDDDESNRRLMQLQLEEAGFGVHAAASGQECLDAVIAYNPHVILLDIQMPALDGIDTCKRLKQHSETCDIPVLFITGRRDDDPTVVEALSAGGNDFLSKDAALPVLLARVRSQIAISLANRRLRELAMTDELTGVYSRRFLYDALRHAIKATARKNRQDEGLACLMVDIDHFKQVNDSFGHLVGDELIQRVAHTIKNATRETDTVARFGGEEFVAILPDTNVSGALFVADRIRRAIPPVCDGVTVSIGVAHLLAGQVEHHRIAAEQDLVELMLIEILQRADGAMYAAKSQGRDCVVVDASASRTP